jgi:hypothetical protein
VSFQAPASNGGVPVTSYTVTSNPAGITATGPASPIVVTGLTNGVAYTFTVRATNAVGTGPASAASNSVTPAPQPYFTSANTTTFTFGSPGTFTVKAEGAPPLTLAATGLPTWASFNASTGVLAGTPDNGSVGSRTITFTASNGSLPNAVQTFTLVVQKANQAITFDPLPDRSFSSASYTLSATAAPALDVIFTSLTPSVCTTSQANGRTLKLVTSGQCSIAADQPGDQNYNPAQRVTRSFTVLAAATTVTAISVSIEPSVTGQSYTVTATMTSANGTPRGSMTFDDGRGSSCTDTNISQAGVASCSLTTNSAGTVTLTATYAGQPGFAPSVGTAQHVVNKAATKVVLGSSANSPRVGTPVTFTATVTVLNPGKGTPTGTVQFTTGATVLGTGTLDANGEASFTTSTLPAGTTPIVAKYLGDGGYLAADSSGSARRSGHDEW